MKPWNDRQRLERWARVWRAMQGFGLCIGALAVGQLINQTDGWVSKLWCAAMAVLWWLWTAPAVIDARTFYLQEREYRQQREEHEREMLQQLGRHE